MSFGGCVAKVALMAQENTCRLLKENFTEKEVPAVIIALGLHDRKWDMAFTVKIFIVMMVLSLGHLFDLSGPQYVIKAVFLSSILLFFSYPVATSFLGWRRFCKKWRELPFSDEEKRAIWRRVEEIFYPPKS